MNFLTWLFFSCCLCVLLKIRNSDSAPFSAENEILIKNSTFMESFAHRMKSLMNTSVDPCDDFYTYACGNFPNHIKDKETLRKRSSFYDMAFVVNEQIDEILKKPRDPSEKYFKELQVAKKFVDTCSSSKLFPVEPSVEYLEVLKYIGGFPAVDPSWKASSFYWFNMTAHLIRYGIVGLVEETITTLYPFSPTYNLPRLGFGFDVSLENIATKESEGYVYNQKIMRLLLQTYGVSDKTTEKVVEEVIDLWRYIEELKAQLPNGNITELHTYCAELSRQPFNNWRNLFEIAWEKKDFSISFVSYCPCRWFYNRLNDLAVRKPKAFANYMALKFLFAMHPILDSAKFQRRECISIAAASMPLIFSHFYMMEHYNNHNEQDIVQLILSIQSSWKGTIRATNWLDYSSYSEAMQKLKHLTWHIGSIDDPTSETYIEQIRSLNLTDNFAVNMLQLSKFRVDMRHYGYLHPNGNTKSVPYEVLGAIQIGAFNMMWKNNINFLAGFLQPPVYHRDLPNAVKYGSLGYAIGHEIGHSFAETGLMFTSNLTRRMWLSEKSLAGARKRTNCFLNDYETFKDPGFNHKLRGRKVLPEIEADSVGLRVSFNALRKVSKHGMKFEADDFTLGDHVPGLNLNNEQTFFLAFAQLYCSKYEPRHYWNEMSASHPLDRYRVMGTLRNSEEFSWVFKCPRDSAMNPRVKCRLW